MTNWRDAERANGDRRRLARELALRCPYCPTINRAGATLIELETETCARCGVCKRTFNPQRQEP